MSSHLRYSPLSNFFRSSFVKQSAILFFSNVISQVIAFSLYPILVLYYSPSEFGVLGLFTSIITVLKIMATGKYDYAIVMAKNTKEADGLFQVSIQINTVFSVLLLGLICIFKILFPSFSYFEQLGFMIYLIPFFVFLSGFCMSCSYYFNRQKQFKNIATADFIANLSTGIWKLILGILKCVKSGLIWAVFIGQASCAFFYLLRNKGVSFHSSKRKQFYIIKRYKNFPLFVMPKELLHNVSIKLPFFLLIFFFSNTYLGFFSLALTFVFTPVCFLGTALTKVLYQKTAENIHLNLSIKPFIVSLLKKMFFIFLPLFIGVFFLIPFLFSILFPERWVSSVLYIQILLPWMFIYLLSSPLDYIPNLFHKQKSAALFDVLYFLLCFSGLLIGVWFNDFVLAILLYCIAGVFMFSILLIWYLRLLTTYEKTRAIKI